jgi:hypothetical protein
VIFCGIGHQNCLVKRPAVSHLLDTAWLRYEGNCKQQMKKWKNKSVMKLLYIVLFEP